MIDLILIALAWLLIAAIVCATMAGFIAVGMWRDRRHEMRLEGQRHDQMARLEGLVTNAQRMVKMLEQPPRPVADKPAPKEVTDAQASIKEAVEEALRESGQLPEGWQ